MALEELLFESVNRRTENRMDGRRIKKWSLLLILSIAQVS